MSHLRNAMHGIYENDTIQQHIEIDKSYQNEHIEMFTGIIYLSSSIIKYSSGKAKSRKL